MNGRKMEEYQEVGARNEMGAQKMEIHMHRRARTRTHTQTHTVAQKSYTN